MDNTRFALEVVLNRYSKFLDTVGPHSAVVNTNCPGDNIRSQIPRIARAVDLSIYRS
jgi:hypothetical protein